MKKGQTLFTIDSPDLLQADSTLIAAAGVLRTDHHAISIGCKMLFTSRAVSQQDVEQATSDQQTAEGNLRAARDAVRIFGKTDAEIDAHRRRAPCRLRPVVPSPIAGRITARNAAPGLFVQPGNTPAPYTVADISTMWMLANVAESDSPAFHVGQEVKVKVMRLSRPRLRRPDHHHRLRPSTRTPTACWCARKSTTRTTSCAPACSPTSSSASATPVRSLAIPLDGVVREGDGTMTAWVTADRRRFTQRIVKIGLQRDGYRPDSRRRCSRRAGRDRRRAVPEQRAHDRASQLSGASASTRDLHVLQFARRTHVIKALLHIRTDAPPDRPAGPDDVRRRRPVSRFSRLNIEAYPNPAPVILEITAQAPGLSAEEMERYYTIPIEVGLAATPGVDIIRSTSFYGLSFVRVTFDYGVDYYFALTQAADQSAAERQPAEQRRCRRSRDRAWSAKSIAIRWSARRISG